MNVNPTDVIGYQVKSLIVLTCMGILAFWATFHSPFLYDDAHAIVENPYIQQLDGYQKNVGIENIFQPICSSSDLRNKSGNRRTRGIRLSPCQYIYPHTYRAGLVFSC